MPLVILKAVLKNQNRGKNQTIVQLYELRQENLATARLINAVDFAAKFDPFASLTLNSRLQPSSIAVQPDSCLFCRKPRKRVHS